MKNMTSDISIIIKNIPCKTLFDKVITLYMTNNAVKVSISQFYFQKNNILKCSRIK